MRNVIALSGSRRDMAGRCVTPIVPSAARDAVDATLSCAHKVARRRHSWAIGKACRTNGSDAAGLAVWSSRLTRGARFVRVFRIVRWWNVASDLPDESNCCRGIAQASDRQAPLKATAHGVVFDILVTSDAVAIQLACRAGARGRARLRPNGFEAGFEVGFGGSAASAVAAHRFP